MNANHTQHENRTCHAGKSFVLATFEGGGSVPPMLGVAERLVARGHRVRVMSDACNREEVEAVGATFVPWNRAPSKPHKSREFDTFDDWSQANPADGFMNLMENLLVGPALGFARDVIEELDREPADLVLASEMLFGVPLGCEAIGQRVALLGVNIPLFPMPGFLPLGPGLTPARNAEDAALHAEILAGYEAMLDGTLPSLNESRRALGLSPLARVVEQHDVRETLFVATSRAFDFAPEVLPEKLQYVGPLLCEPGWAESWTSPFAPDDPRPLALVSFSTTFQNHVGVLQRVIDAIASLPMRAVVTLGSAIRTDEIRGAENVAIVQSAPHGAVMREASIVVTHGGHGTVMKALAHRRPLLVVPHGRDQDDNAARVVARGAGLKVDRSGEVEDFRAAIERLLDDPAFAAAASALGAKVAEEAEQSRLIEELERLASTNRKSPATGRDAASFSEPDVSRAPLFVS
jgi:MGT family glycosyltransferase